MEFAYILMDECTKGFGRTTNETTKEESYSKTDLTTRETSRMVMQRAEGFLSAVKENIKEIYIKGSL